MKKPLLSFTAFLVASVVVFSCKTSNEAQEHDKFIDVANIDSSVQPGDNFFQFVNGKWLKTATIPETETGVGASKELYNRTKENLRLILEDAAKGSHQAGSIEQQVGDFFISGMDSITIDKLGYEPVKPALQKIDAITDAKGIMQFVAEQQKELTPLLFIQYVGADEKNSKVNIAVYYQGGLGLPDRDYYFKTDAETVAVQQAYKTYLQKLFVLTGNDTIAAAKNVDAVYSLEKELATRHRTNVELRDPQSNYNKMAVADLQKQQPVFGWATLLPSLNVNADSVNVSQPGYFAQVNKLLQSVPVETWKAYLKAHVLSASADALSSDFVNANFEYTGKALSGQQKLKPRWERIYMATDGNLGEALGQLYVKKYFTEDAKKRMLDLVNNLQKAFENRIGKLDWMSDSTKQTAKAKLNTFLKKIGYTDKWRDYSKVSIDKGRYYDNLVSASKNEYNYQVSKVGKPVDKTEWIMSPPTINAYYNPTFNEIVFPAGILQFPFFDEKADDAINYGGIGMVIGHEMTHGFDDQGAQYDKEGNMKNWWAQSDNAKFNAKKDLVINLYNSFTMLDSLHINGALTTGENMADIGGIAIAYDAFKMTEQGKDTARIGGLTPDQRFFMAFASMWRSKLKDETIRQRINTDPHSPPMYRVNGPLMNFTPFYAAFNVKEGNKMYKPESERIKIW
jgi:putative endopeptidase